MDGAEGEPRVARVHAGLVAFFDPRRAKIGMPPCPCRRSGRAGAGLDAGRVSRCQAALAGLTGDRQRVVGTVDGNVARARSRRQPSELSSARVASASRSRARRRRSSLSAGLGLRSRGIEAAPRACPGGTAPGGCEAQPGRDPRLRRQCPHPTCPNPARAAQRPLGGGETFSPRACNVGTSQQAGQERSALAAGC
jgi:hypothetical protein